MRKVLVCLILSTFVFVGSAQAGGPIAKLGRGLMNTTTGWIELFTTMYEAYEEEPAITGLIYGIPLGLTRARMMRIESGSLASIARS